MFSLTLATDYYHRLFDYLPAQAITSPPIRQADPLSGF
jgi:hypothetical protein